MKYELDVYMRNLDERNCVEALSSTESYRRVCVVHGTADLSDVR